MGKWSREREKSPLERLPQKANADHFFYFLQSWRDPAQIVLTALSSLCFTLAGTLGLQSGPVLAGSIGGGIFFATILIVGRLVLFKPTYAELLRDRSDRMIELTDAQKKLSESQDEHRGDLQRVLDTLMTYLLEHVSKQADDCRISTYSVEGEEFLLLSRCSRNPVLEVRGRPSYPLNEGNIGQAWAKSWALQDHESMDREEWEETLVDAGLFSPDVAASLTMQCQSIYAQRIDRGSEKLGIVVIECENPGMFNRTTVQKVQRSLILKSVAEILWSSHKSFPRVAARTEELLSSESTVKMPEPEWKQARPIPKHAVKNSAHGVEDPSQEGEK